MNFSRLRQRFKPLVLPLAIIGGLLFHDFICSIAFLAPYLLFLMLLITYCIVSLKEFRVNSFTWALLAVQIAGSIAIYFALLPFNPTVAQATFMCVFCPTATAAPVITSMLGGSIARVATFSILSNMSVAVLAPPLFSMMGDNCQLDFIGQFTTIGSRILPLLVMPLLIALLLRRFMPKVSTAISSRQSISFYLWAVGLFIVVGRAVTFVMKEPLEQLPIIIIIALLSCIVCCLQFYIGRKIGAKHGDTIAGGQGLGQKNTILAVWMALTYLHPLASIGPAAYVFWQNTINSWQLYRKTRQECK